MSDTEEIIQVQTEPDALSQSVNDLRNLCDGNIEYFRNDTSDTAKSLVIELRGIYEVLIKSEPLVNQVSGFFHEYDFDEHTPGNGYRSFVSMYEDAIKYCLKYTKDIQNRRRRLFFRKKTAEK